MTFREPWQGLLVAPALAWADGGDTLDADRYGAHIAWLAANGCDGVTPNGSLGEYATLSDDERKEVVRVSVDAAPDDFSVIPGVASYGARQARRWAEQAAEAGCPAVMLLPPNSYRADRRTVVDHYRTVSEVGIPIVAYNNPIDTKVDLTPELLAELFDEGLIVAVKDFSGDVRRPYRTYELCPDLDLIVGADDVVVELAVAGAVGWISGFANVFPHASRDLFEFAAAGRMAEAVALYRILHALLRWDSQTEFVQAIKLSMDEVGLYGGPCRQPRLPLTAEQAAEVRAATAVAVEAGLR